MTRTRVIATPDIARASQVHGGDTIGIALFHKGKSDLPGLGERLPKQFRKGLPSPPSNLAWDFLSIALAAFAADRFVLRRNADDGWTRVIELEVAVNEPTAWTPQAARLAAALRFLTGDVWRVSFTGGGKKPAQFQGTLQDRDTVCLFSGGLDSLLGALKLLDEKKRPLLISQGSPKEVTPQKYLATMIGLEEHRFEGKVIEHWHPPYEGSTRGRSLIFFAYGIVAASALGLKEVIVPENGFIAINPPLTRRRIGSLSTRTVHPHFLSEINSILHDVGIKIELRNIFESQSKGEMLSNCSHARTKEMSKHSYSCGKGKRKNKQCGRCIPCLIRRASFSAASMADGTPYQYEDLSHAAKNDDIMAARLAIARTKLLTPEEFERWVAMAGPLPADPRRRAGIVRAVSKGVEELDALLSGIQWR